MRSKNYKNWIAILDLKTCKPCRRTHGQIYEMDEIVLVQPPLHRNCRCEIEAMVARMAGTCTTLGKKGADWELMHHGVLPAYYITETDAKKAGYISYLGNLLDVAPGQMLTKGIYSNRNGHLPDAPDRIWYEADINYETGYRGDGRVLFSNDGLIFVTYDHYKTFVEVV